MKVRQCMFTGLILFLATIIAIETTDQGKNFIFSHPNLRLEIKLGDSIAINGVCLTATDITDTTFSVQAVHTTLEKTTLDYVREGDMVNVELALKASDRCGGHFVQGHVNGVGTIKSIIQRGNAHDLQITIPAHLQKYLLQEGSIAIDGISLTIADVHDDLITLAIIPHTWQHTTLHNKKSGDLVNIEVDILTKYCEETSAYSSRAHKKVVIVGGVFDVLHKGHFQFLEEAKKQGDFLVVLLEPDEKVKKTKSTTELPRPFHNEQMRQQMVSNIKCVDKVITLPYLTSYAEYLNFLKHDLPEIYHIKPDVIAITGNDPIKKLKQKMATHLAMELVAVVERIEPFSSTTLLQANCFNQNKYPQTNIIHTKGNTMKLHTIEQALADIAQGKMIIVVDDENRENEGDFLMAAQHVTPEAINFMARYGRGLICAPITAATAQKLEITPMVMRNNAPLQTAFTVSIEAAEGVSTGISAHDRSRTISLLTQEASRPETFVKPGHVFPLVAKDGGVLQRPGHTEAAVDFARLAGLHPSGVICEIMKDDGTMARLPDLWNFAQEHRLTLVSIKDLIAYRKKHEQLVQQIAAIDLHSEYGTFTLHCFHSLIDQQEVVALVKGEISHDEAVLVRIHSECFTGETLKSQRCDCGEQLSLALSQIERAASGILIYLKQEGRGIGLSNKIKAYALQDQGFDTVEANHQLGFATDMRDYVLGAQVLKHFGITKIKLLTNNPEKVEQLTTYGIEIAERQALEIPPQKYNCAYLATKKYKLGHILS